MDAETEQPLIELTSHDDLSYLIANVRAAAAEHIEQAFPRVEGQRGKNTLRTEVEALVNQYIDNTFGLAAPNLRINGHTVTADDALDRDSSRFGASGDDDALYEPYDADKRRMVADLITQEERLLEEVAALKRSVPSATAAEQAEHFDAAVRRDEEALQSRLAAEVPRATAESRDIAWSPLERQEGVETRFRGAVEGLERVKKDMPSIVAKLERARVAGDYVIKGSN